MVAEWSPERVFQQRSAFAQEPIDDAKETIGDHVTRAALGDVNKTQRVILIAESFDYSLLKTAEWLRERYRVDIRCYRIEYVHDDGGEYISCVRIFPPQTIVDSATRVREKNLDDGGISRSWHNNLERIKNASVKSFFAEEGKTAARGNSEGDLHYRIRGVRRFGVYPRINRAYVWQTGRFADDQDFWGTRLSAPTRVQPVRNGQDLSFVLQTENDLQRFREAISGSLQGVSFREPEDGPPVAEDGDPSLEG